MTPLYRFTCGLAWLLIKVFYRHKIFGQDHIPKGGAIIAANHASVLDPPLIAISWDKEIAFLARSGLFEIKWLGWLIKRLNAFPLSESSSDLNAMRLIGKLVKKNQQVLIFPEGHRSFNGHLQPLKSGVATLATRFECPIIPCYIAGSFDAWPKGKKCPQFSARTACVIGSPINPKKFSHLERKVQQQEVQKILIKKIESLSKWYKEGQKGPIP